MMPARSRVLVQAYFHSAVILSSLIAAVGKGLVTRACAAGSGLTSSVSPVLSARLHRRALGQRAHSRSSSKTHALNSLFFQSVSVGHQCGPKTGSQASLEDGISEPPAASPVPAPAAGVTPQAAPRQQPAQVTPIT